VEATDRQANQTQRAFKDCPSPKLHLDQDAERYSGHTGSHLLRLDCDLDDVAELVPADKKTNGKNE
jgi:hypothetical protein